MIICLVFLVGNTHATFLFFTDEIQRAIERAIETKLFGILPCNDKWQNCMKVVGDIFLANNTCTLI